MPLSALRLRTAQRSTQTLFRVANTAFRESGKRKKLKSISPYLLFLFLWLSPNERVWTQSHYDLDPYLMDLNTVTIPFHYENNFMVVEVRLDKYLGANFIIDTGAQYTLITKKRLTEFLQFFYLRQFKVMGADQKREIVAHLVAGIDMDIGKLSVDNNAMLILDEDYFLFEELTGREIHGIIGGELLRRFVMKIDYQREKITFYNPKTYKRPKRKYQEIDIEVQSNKPYITLPTVVESGADTISLKYLIDTGAGMNLMLNPLSSDSLNLPANFIPGNIGTGLGGDIEGFVGRVQGLSFGNQQLQDVITSYHDMDSTYLTIDERNGLIGNKLLERFSLIIDYPRGKLYYHPLKNIKKKFEYDKSGLTLLTGGKRFQKIVVQRVLEGSPAAEAGIKKGDEILGYNWLPGWLISLPWLNKKMRGKEGKEIKLKIRRGNQQQKYTFRLRKLI